MNLERKKILRAAEIIRKLANGKEPYSDEDFHSLNFLQDPRIIRCFFYTAEVLETVAQNRITGQPKPKNFIITPEQLAKVNIPEGNIGVNAFCKAVNHEIDPYKSRKLTGAKLNKKLKSLNILTEKKTEKGTYTATNDNSEEFGFLTIKKEFNEKKYFQVVMNQKGKEYLLKNLIEIMEVNKEGE